MLITTIAQIRTASAINISNNIDNWLPYLADAEEMFIIPVIGQPLYDAMIDYLSNSGSTDVPSLDELIAKVRKALALYALALGIDEMAVSISSSGVQTIQSDTHRAAPQYQVMNLKETYLTRAHMQVDSVLKYISANVVSLPAVVLPKSPYFIRNAGEFQVYADIHSSRRVFLSLLPIMGSIEHKYLKPTLSTAQFDDLKVKFQAGGQLTAADQALVDLIQPALVHLTMARALLEISIDTLDWGIFNNASNTFNSLQTKSQANKERISAMHDSNQRDGEAELKMLQEYLDNNASTTKYALYYASGRYIGAENAVQRGEFVNETAKSIFVV